MSFAPEPERPFRWLRVYDCEQTDAAYEARLTRVKVAMESGAWQYIAVPESQFGPPREQPFA